MKLVFWSFSHEEAENFLDMQHCYRMKKSDSEVLLFFTGGDVIRFLSKSSMNGAIEAWNAKVKAATQTEHPN